MDRFNYAVALLSIITGLGLSDYAISLHRLMKRRGQIRWDPLLVGLATYLSFATIRLWYQQWTVHDFPGVTDLPVVAATVVSLLLLVLSLVASLPDESDLHDDEIDLRSYYAQHGSYVWRLLLAHQLSWALLGMYFATRAFTSAAFLHSARPWLYFIPPLALTAVAAFQQTRRVQAAALALIATHDLWMNWALHLR